MNPIEKTFVLDPSACDEVAEQITAFGERLKLERKDILRYRLAAEECLLFWMARDGEGAPVQLRMGQRIPGRERRIRPLLRRHHAEPASHSGIQL